jgi:rhodanese-related sulfurtransferase
MKTITPTELQTRLQNSPEILLLDVRTPAEFDQFHIPQARNEPLDQLDLGRLRSQGSIDEKRDLYLICQSGQRAGIAAKKFAAQGFDGGVVLEGGTQAWVAAGLPVTRGASKVISLERQVRIVAGSLVLLGAILGWFVHPYFFGLSAFVGGGLVFAGITDFCGMGLLLAKFPWNNSSRA